MEFSDIQLFIKNNCKIVSLNIDYTNEGDIHNYVINIQGINHKLKLIEEGEDVIKLIYNDNTFTDENEIQLELFELFNYKNIEYIDCYLLKKQQTSGIEVLNMYDDYYDNNDGILICNRSYVKDGRTIKIKIIVYDNGADYKMYYNLEEIMGFEEIIKKLDLIL